jgi:protein phosphatase
MIAPVWSLEMASASDRGRVRSQNEDSLAANPELGYAVLADGMGGCNAGEVASRIAVETVDREMRELARNGGLRRNKRSLVEKAVTDRVLSANAAIYLAAQADPAYAGMGTTLVMALWRDDLVVVAHVGDSRVYRMRQGALEQLTRDHSLLQEQIERGLVDKAHARSAPGRNIVTRALGVEPGVEVEVHRHLVQSGDLYLLCSDGLSDMLDERALATTLRSAGRDLDSTADALVRQANDNGGRDNISVILARLRMRDTSRAEAGG